MPENKHLQFLLRLTYCTLALGGIWLCGKYLLGWLLPFLIAFALATLLERGVQFLMARLHLPRWGAAVLCTLLLAGVVLGGLTVVLWRAGYEVSLLLGRLPTFLSALPSLGHQVEDWAYRLLIALPVQFQEVARGAVDDLITRGISLPNRMYDGLAGAVTATATLLPNAALLLFTTTLATYFTSATRPTLLAFLTRQIPPRWHGRLVETWSGLRRALGGWLKAQGILMLITFGELTVGFLLLRVELALLLAALFSLLDALPVFGTGTVLLPWALFSLLGGDSQMALALLLLYGVITLVRNLLEPKLVGDRIGLPPLAALLCMYVGFSALGVVGMIFSPLMAILLKQLHDSGILKLWK